MTTSQPFPFPSSAPPPPPAGSRLPAEPLETGTPETPPAASPVFIAFTAALTLPWLWPSTWGPLTNAVPWMVSAACAMVALALSGWLPRGQAVRALAWSLVAAAGLNAFVAWAQLTDLASQLRPWVAQSSTGMAYGNLRQPNQLASLLAMGLWASLYLWRISAPERTAARTALVAGMVLMTSAMVASASRIGMVHIGLLWLGCLWWWWMVDRPRQRPQAWALPVLATGIALLYAFWMTAAPALKTVLGSTSSRDLVSRLAAGDSLCGSRLTLWDNVLHLIAIKPWTGWGWGNLDWAHYMTLYDGPRFCHILDNAHNLPLHLAVELGLPAALLICGLPALAVWRARPWRETLPARRLAWGALLVMGTHSMVEYPLWYGPFQLTAVCAACILMARPASGDADWRWLGRPAAGPAWPLVAAVLGSAVLAYAAHDYWRISQLFLATSDRAPAYADNTLEKVQDTRLFRSTVDFATLSVTPVNPGNAAQMLELAERSLRYSPEPRVIEKLLTSAQLLGRVDLVRDHQARFKAAFPKDFLNWQQNASSTN